MKEIAMPNATDDRVLYWPSVLAVVGPVIFVFTWTAPFSVVFFDLIPQLVLLLWVASAAIAGMACVVWLEQRAWRRLFSTAVLPLVVLVAGLNLGFVWRNGRTAGDYIHLFAMYPQYMAEISAMPADQRRFAVWQWDGFLTQGYGVVYDESDEIGSTNPSQAFKKMADDYGVAGYGYPRAYGHFYFVGLR